MKGGGFLVWRIMRAPSGRAFLRDVPSIENPSRQVSRRFPEINALSIAWGTPEFWHRPCSPPYSRSRPLRKEGTHVRNRAFLITIVLALTITIGTTGSLSDSWAWSNGGGSGSGSGGSSGSGGGAGGSGGGAGGGGAGGGSGGGTGGGGAGASAGGGDSRSGGGSAVSVGAGVLPGDVWVAGDAETGKRLASTGTFSFSQPAPSFFGLTKAQEHTWDTFRSCAPHGAILDQLGVDGSFTFQATLLSDVHSIKACMTQAGYRFTY